MARPSELSARSVSGHVEFPGLDAWRGIAVALVVVHHAATLAGPERTGWLATPAACMDVGVAIFFVLSGFLIWRPYAVAHATGVEPQRARVFWWRRALRILPAYWLALTFFWWSGVIRPDSFGDLLSHYTLLNVFRPSALFGGISQGWSLTAEVCFYLAVPGVSVLLRRGVAPGRVVPVRHEVVVIAAVTAVAHAFRILTHSVDWHVGPAELRGISYLWLPTHMDLIAGGMALAVVWAAREHRVVADPPDPPGAAHAGRPDAASAWWAPVTSVMHHRLGVGLTGMAAFVAYAWTFGGPSVTSGYSILHLEVRQLTYLVVGLAAIGPLALATPGRGGRSARRGRLGWWAGAMSYAVYLWHNDWMKRLVIEVGQRPRRGLPAWVGSGLGDMNVAVLLAVGFGAGLFGAVVSRVCVEDPAARLRGLVTASDPSPFHRLSPRARTTLALAIVSAVLLAPLAGLMRYQGPPMEEGFMLAFPMQLLEGRVPHRDFLHLYGPGSLWMLAAVFKVFGSTLTVERLVGLAQHAAMAVGMFALLRPWGRRIAVIGSCVSVVILIGPLGLSAMAWNGGLAAATCGLAASCEAVRRCRAPVTGPVTDPGPPDLGRSGRWGSVPTPRLVSFAGVAAGVALLFRPDLVVAVTLGCGAAASMLPTPLRRRLVLAAAVPLALYVPHLLIAGPANAVRGMFIEPVFELRGGRSLPLPPSWGELDGFLQRAGALRTSNWGLPMPDPSQQVFLWFFAVPAAAVLCAAVAWRGRRTGSPAGAAATTLWPASLFGLGLLTQALQRPDTAHLSWVSGYVFAVAVAACAEPLAGRLVPARRAWVAAAPVLVGLVAVIPFYPVRTYVDLVGQSAGFNRFGYEIRRDDRVFYFGDATGAASAQRVTDELAARARPGEKLIVGPVDLSKTPYSDAFFYYLFPELRVGTRYIEMDPGIADAADSGLADELRAADWLVASDAWSAWDEPNDSRLAGSPEPNEVVAAQYCTVTDAGTFRLLRRCR